MARDAANNSFSKPVNVSFNVWKELAFPHFFVTFTKHKLTDYFPFDLQHTLPLGPCADRGRRHTDTRREGGRCFHPDRQKLSLQDPQCGLRLVVPRVGARRPRLPDAVSLRASLCLTVRPARATRSLGGSLEEKNTEGPPQLSRRPFGLSRTATRPELEAVGVAADKDLGQ